MTTKAKMMFLSVGVLISVVTACLGLETQHGNHLGWALLFSGTAFCAVGCLVLGVLFLKDRNDDQPDDRSLWLPTTGVLIISIITPLEYLYLPPILPRSDQAQDIGLILFAGGLAFYLLSLQTSNPWGNRTAPPAAAGFHPDSVLMKMCLCPISASLILFAAGLGIGYSSLSGLLVFLLLILPGLFHRLIRMGV